MMKQADERNRLESVEVFDMQLSGVSMGVCLLVGSVFAQSAEDVLKSKLTTVRYAPLAEQARIQGDVRLSCNNGTITVFSGHPRLAPTAVASARGLGSSEGKTNLDLTYHFVLVDTAKSVPTVTTMKRGNAFERVILRVLGLKTEKVVHGYRCEEGDAPATRAKVTAAAIEVWVYGRTRGLQTNTATLVARR